MTKMNAIGTIAIVLWFIMLIGGAIYGKHRFDQISDDLDVIRRHVAQSKSGDETIVRGHITYRPGPPIFNNLGEFYLRNAPPSNNIVEFPSDRKPKMGADKPNAPSFPRGG